MTGAGSAEQRTVLVVLAAACALALAALLVPAAGSDWILAGAAAIVPVGLMALGAAGARGRASRLSGAVFATLAAVLAVSVFGLLALAGRGAGAEGAAPSTLLLLQLVGLWLLPLPVATLGYALTFDRTGLDRQALQELRSRYGRREPAPKPPASGR